jgi:Family of unknown function (DUF6335)
MAKRKAARATGRKAASARGSAGRSKARAKAAARKGARKAGRTSAGARKGARKATARRASGGTSRKATARKAAAKKTAARKAPARSAPAARAASPKAVPPRKAPNLNRERRIVQDDDSVVSVPSSLDLDRRASAARTGRRELREKFSEHTETSPQLTGGDVDADWESAYSVGDEAPGGDNPTPDQDIVDDIGRAVGVEYQDNEELKGADKVAKRDKHRWELDPASSEDYDDRD